MSQESQEMCITRYRSGEGESSDEVEDDARCHHACVVYLHKSNSNVCAGVQDQVCNMETFDVVLSLANFFLIFLYCQRRYLFLAPCNMTQLGVIRRVEHTVIRNKHKAQISWLWPEHVR